MKNGSTHKVGYDRLLSMENQERAGRRLIKDAFRRLGKHLRTKEILADKYSHCFEQKDNEKSRKVQDPCFHGTKRSAAESFHDVCVEERYAPGQVRGCTYDVATKQLERQMERIQYDATNISERKELEYEEKSPE